MARMTTRFEVLCAQFCELAGVAPPAVDCSANGLAAFDAEMLGVRVTIANHAADGDSVLVVAALGGVPPAHESDAMRNLLDANFLMFARNAPVFSRNPVTGEFTLQCVHDIAQCTAQSLYARVTQLSELALRWRAGCFASSETFG
jgi:hypothetical protein